MIKTTCRGVHDRPNKSTFAQSGPGLPDDASQPVEVGRSGDVVVRVGADKRSTREGKR